MPELLRTAVVVSCFPLVWRPEHFRMTLLTLMDVFITAGRTIVDAVAVAPTVARRLGCGVFGGVVSAERDGGAANTVQ